MTSNLRRRVDEGLLVAASPQWLNYLRLFRRAVVEVCAVQIALVVTFTVIYACIWIVESVS